MAALKVALCVLFFAAATFAQCNTKNYVTFLSGQSSPTSWRTTYLSGLTSFPPPNGGKNFYESGFTFDGSWFTQTLPVANVGYSYCGLSGYSEWFKVGSASDTGNSSGVFVTNVQVPSTTNFGSWFVEFSVDEHLEGLYINGNYITGSGNITQGPGSWGSGNCNNAYNFTASLTAGSTVPLAAVVRNRDTNAGASFAFGWFQCSPSATPTISPIGGADPYFADEHGHGYFTNDVGPLILCANDQLTITGYSVNACNATYLIPSVLVWNKDSPVHPTCQVLHRASEKDFSDVVNDVKYTTVRTELCKVGSFTYLQHFLLIEECGFETVFLEMHNGSCNSGYMSHAAFVEAEKLMEQM